MASLTALAGPAYLANSATNIVAAPASGFVKQIRAMHFCNVTNATATFTVYIGATGGSTGGTELFKTYSLGAFATYDYYVPHRLSSSDYLTGLASAASTITITVSGEHYAV